MEWPNSVDPWADRSSCPWLELKSRWNVGRPKEERHWLVILGVGLAGLFVWDWEEGSKHNEKGKGFFMGSMSFPPRIRLSKLRYNTKTVKKPPILQHAI